VGAAGGVGGFFLPSLMGAVKGSTGSFGFGFLLFGIYAALCLAILCTRRHAWRRAALRIGGPIPAEPMSVSGAGSSR
jgi:NNP family nitrate/nitrite transporter-like MFS transporter